MRFDKLTIKSQEALQEAQSQCSARGHQTLEALHLLGGLDSPSAGTVEVMGTDLFSIGPVERGKLRNRFMGFVYQFHHLFSVESA